MKTKTEWLVKIWENWYPDYMYFGTKEKAKKFIMNYYRKNKDKITQIEIICERYANKRSMYYNENIIYQKFPNGSSKIYPSSMIKFNRGEL